MEALIGPKTPGPILAIRSPFSLTEARFRSPKTRLRLPDTHFGTRTVCPPPPLNKFLYTPLTTTDEYI